MAVNKFLKILNTGRFTSLVAAGDVSLRKMSVVYGDNGTGKTTVVEILRSLATGNAAYLTERTTLGSKGAPEVQLLVDGKPINFRNGAWSDVVTGIEIFDGTFVADNVYAGESVDSEHRKNLYQVVVGPIAVRLAKRVDELDSDGRAKSREITGKEVQVRAKMQAPFPLEEFLSLQPASDVETQISELTGRLSAARNASQVVARRELDVLPVPTSPRALLGILSTGVVALAAKSKERVQRHISNRLDSRGESWLKQGVGYVRDDSCPFCAQSTAGVELVDAVKAYFSDEYEQHVVQIERAQNEVEATFSSRQLHAVKSVALENHGRVQVWSDLIDLSAAEADLDRFEAAWMKVADTLGAALRAKLANPSREMPADQRLEAAVQDFEDAANAIATVNARIRSANASIGDVKKKAASESQSDLEDQLRRLRNSQIRQEPAVAALCDELKKARSQKLAIETEKELVRSELTKQAEKVLSDYEGAINRLLASFGASFRLQGTKPSFAGGRASSTYKLSINNVAVDVGDSRTPRGTPCFRSVLSAGDKSALALAFFLARIDNDAELNRKIVVFDDPLTSLDSFRVTFTQQQILRVVERADQVIVLSHDPFFLKGIVDLADDKGNVKALELKRDGKTRTIALWNIEQYCLAEAHKDYFVLRRFLDEGLPTGTELQTVARSIRPYVEGYLRHRFPDRFGNQRMFGDMISEIENAPAGDELVSLQSALPELEDINQYSRKFHHGSSGSSSVTTDTELQSYASRALDFVRRAS